MKIEIELSEVEYMRKEIERLEEKNEKIQKELSGLDKSAIKQKGIDLGVKIFQDSMMHVFEQLGFDVDYHSCIARVTIDSDLLHAQFGNGRYNSPPIKVDFGAVITNQFKNAFLSLSIDMDKLKGEDE